MGGPRIDCLVDDRIWVRLPFSSPESRKLTQCYCYWSTRLPHFCLPRGVTTLDSAIRRGGGESLTRSSTCGGMLASGNAKPGE